MARSDDLEGVELTRQRGNEGFSDFDFPQNIGTDRRWKRLYGSVICVGVIGGLAILLSIIALAIAAKANQGEGSRSGVKLSLGGISIPKPEPSTKNLVEKIAFGSCTSHFVGSVPIWNTGVVPSKPDAWIWLGDFVYMDSPFLSCNDPVNNSQCEECDYTFLSHPPHSCQTGDLDHALAKAQKQVEEPGYLKFLNYMCPDFRSKGVFPPYGTDPEYCPKPILGTWDDHDSGWNDGNKRYPKKFEMKQIYLDVIGEKPSSPRRNSISGIQWKYTLNHSSKQAIDVFLLDERYNRDALPCHVRKEWCTSVLKNGTDADKFDAAWCDDFWNSGGVTGGSCCETDELWAEWCEKADKADVVYPIACDPTSPSFGQMNFRLEKEFGILKVADQMTWNNVDQEAPFCEMLGMSQRSWLEDGLQKSDAALTIIASGSVLFGNPDFVGDEGKCSGDDWECYHPAQLNLIHMLERSVKGCVIVLTGDYHFSDIKVLKPGKGNKYSDRYQTEKLTKPIYQVMSSGMTTQTAKYSTEEEGCSSFREDLAGLRPGGKCSMVLDPSFGMLDIDWESRIAKMQLRDHKNGKKVAKGYDGKLMELAIDIDTCNQV
ncbi:hypothetical protein BSKO_13735 [Bryopsis sp. KO-2023]|nr:hypothetical protein BSKO_13735 [Bryopsis sp. KO-2023]